MTNYLYTDNDKQSLTQRFSIDNDFPVNGLEEWRKYISCILSYNYSDIKSELETLTLVKEVSNEEKTLLILLKKLKEEYQPLSCKIPCPRLFISHRQGDEKFALRIAQLAANNGFYFWVDILDPGLAILNTNPNISPTLIPLLTACIIEMALINCTHVISCMTPKTKGSTWVPYEYGRITDLPNTFTKAAAWVHPNLGKREYLPEYMYLGEITHIEKEIEEWLNNQRKRFQSCPHKQIRIDLLVYQAKKLPKPKRKPK